MKSLALALLSAAGNAYGCSCVHQSDCALAGAPVAFVGKVIAGGVESVRDDPWHKAADFVRFEVLETFRGLAPGTKTVEVKTFLLPGMCNANPYFRGNTYLVTPGQRDGVLQDGGCFSGRDIRYAKDTLEFLRTFRSPGIRGRVVAVESLDYSDVAEGQALAGARVSLRTSGKTVYTVTDAEGRYSLPAPAPGAYTLRAESAPYEPLEMRVDKPNRTCSLQNFLFTSGSTIAGHLRDRQGRALGRAEVALVSAAGTQTLRTTRRDTASGAFSFRNVPVGRYLLLFDSGDTPFEAAWYPNSTTRDRAEVIEITGTGMNVTDKNIVAGAPVGWRPLTLKARFEDGEVMGTARFEVTAEPTEPGGIPWRRQAPMWRDKKEVVLQVPANRRLRVSVRDEYDRDLGRTYETDLAPGFQPVAHEFVIVAR